VRLLRRVVPAVMALCVSMGAVGIGTALPVSAAMNCATTNNTTTCNWTQIDNGNWPANSSDPNCNDTSGDSTRGCQEWLQDCSQTLYYSNGWSSNRNYWMFSVVNWAANTWNSVPQCTPSFHESESGNALVSYYSGHLGTYSSTTAPCAETFVYSTNQGGVGAIDHVNIVANEDVGWYQSPPPNDGHINCNMKSAQLHETGHSYGEGHSSVAGDLMYPWDNNTTAIDQDAHAMLAAVYGTGAPACTSCQYDLWLHLPDVHPLSPVAYEQMVTTKALAAAQAALNAEGSAAAMVQDTAYWARCAGSRVKPGCLQ